MTDGTGRKNPNHQDDGVAIVRPDSAVRVEPKPGRRKRRRFIRAIVVLLAAFVIMVITVPWVISWPPVSNYAVSMVNSTLRGQVHLDKLSVSWFGPTVLEGLEIRDPANRPVIQVGRVELASGVLSLPSLRDSFGELVIHKPKIVLHLDDDRHASLLDAFAPADAEETAAAESLKETSPDASLTVPQGVIKINNGTIEVSRGDRGPTESFDLSGRFNIRSLNDIEGLLAITLSGGSHITGELSVKDLASDGRVDVQEASGTIKLAMDRPAQIGAIAEILLQQTGLAGEAMITLDARIAPNDLVAEIDAQVVGFRSEGRAARQAAPLDAGVRGTVSVKDNRILGRLTLSGTPGMAQTDFSYQITESVSVISGDEILAAALGGPSISLPDFSLSVDGHFDLAAFDRAVPGLIPLQAGQSLVGGFLKITDLRASGGSAPAISGSLQLDNLAAKHVHRITTLSPISLDLSARLEPGVGMVLDRADLSSASATVTATGSINELRAQFQSDLSALQEELGQIVDLSQMRIAGRIDGSLALSRPSEELINTNLHVNAQQLRYDSGDWVFELARGSISESGHVQFVDQKLTRIVAGDLSANLNDEVIATAKGWFDPATQAFGSSVNVRQLDLAAAARRGASLGLDALAGYGGQISGKLTAKREGGAAPILSSGSLTAQRMSMNGRRLLERDAAVTWSDLRIETSGDVVVASAGVQSEVAEFETNLLRLDSNTDGFPVGKVSGSADLARVLGVIGVITGEPKTADLRGRFVFSADVAPFENGVRVVGSGKVAPLEFQYGDGVLRESVKLTWDAGVDLKNHRIVLDTARVTSKPVSIGLKGSVEKYDSDLVASIQGDYSLSWKEVTSVLHSLAPSTGT